MLRGPRRRPPILPRGDLIRLQPRAERILTQALRAPSHAYLFHGPWGTGKRDAALWFSQRLICGCGNCPDCRRVLEGNHPDVRFWEPEGRSTKIEQVRQLIRATEMGSYEGGRKVHVLDAQSLTPEAANCLLKTLEEPRQDTVLLLLAESLDRILPTLVSRCQSVPFRLLPPQAIEEVIKDLAPEARTVARLADGRIERALELLEAPPPTLSPLLNASLGEALAEGEKLAALPEKEQIAEVESMIAQVRDIMVWKETRNPLLLAFSQVPETFGKDPRTVRDWLKTMDRLIETRQGLFSHANAKLSWAVLAAEIHR